MRSAVGGAGTTVLWGAGLLRALGGGLWSARVGEPEAIATQLFGSWFWPFELLSLLLLVALIAAFGVSRMPSTSTEGDSE